MRTPANISVCRLTNTGHLRIVVHFSPDSTSKISVNLPGGSSTDLYTIPLGVPGDVLHFTARAEDGTVYNIELYYNAEDAGNQFYFKVLLPGEEGVPQQARSATTPGKNIAMNLVCDGVVVVGTGDMQ
jgi:hypothetical protein